MNETFLIGAGLLALGIAIGGILAGLFGRMAGLENRLKTLEDCKQSRLPYKTADGVEDAQAVNMDLVRQANELEVMSQALRLRAAQQAEILKLVRQGPDAYDSDRPAGLRPK